MPAVTAVEVANMALDLLTEGQIDSLEEDSRPARLLSRHYEVTREAELASHAWSFAIVFPEDITATDSQVDGTYRYLYALPDDCIRPLWLTRDGTPDGVPLNWTRWSDGLRSDFEGPLSVPYIANLTDPNDWDALFTQAFAAALAAKIAHPLTGKQSLAQGAQQAYQGLIQQAYRVNAIQRWGRTPNRSWSVARGDLRHWR